MILFSLKFQNSFGYKICNIILCQEAHSYTIDFSIYYATHATLARYNGFWIVANIMFFGFYFFCGLGEHSYKNNNNTPLPLEMYFCFTALAAFNRGDILRELALGHQYPADFHYPKNGKNE